MNEEFKRDATAFFVVIAVSLAVQVFQSILGLVTDFHATQPWLIGLLPIAWIGFWLSCLPRDWKNFESTDQVLREVSKPENRINPWLAPLIAVRTWWSHLFGASVGREGTALQMAGSIADSASAFFRFGDEHRRALLRVALAAGLASAYRTPFAGFVFALELGGTSTWRNRIEALVGAWLSYRIASFVFPNHGFDLPIIDFDFAILFDPKLWLVFLGLIAFAPAFKIIFLILNRPLRHRPHPLRWAIGGVVGLALFSVWSQDPLRNTGTLLIDQAMSDNLTGWIALKKTFLTAVFCATGWFGGDFTPNMASGAAAGNILAGFAGFSFPILAAALGLFLPVAFTHRILLTGWVMTLEYFGWRIALVAAPVFLAAWGLEKLMERHLFAKLRG